jgi:NitT/TauT family transport system substrate-binding protein
MKNRTVMVRVLIALLAIALLAACAPAAAPTAAPAATTAPAATAAPAATTAPVAAPTTAPAPVASGDLVKFPFRLNWTFYGEHAGFIAARDLGYYEEEGLDVEIMEGSGSTTVAQLIASGEQPVAYIDSATMMRGVAAGMPIKAVAVMLQQSPMAFIYRADAAKPTSLEEIKGSRIAVTAGDASMAIFTAFMGKSGMKVDDVQLITVSNPAAKEQAVLAGQADALLGYFMDQGPRMQLQSGVKMGWTRLYDMNGTTTLSSAIVANKSWLEDPKNQENLRKFLRASQRGWQWTSDNRDEAAAMFIKTATAFNQEIAKLEIDGTMTIVRSEATKDKPLGFSDAKDWQDTQDLLSTFAGLTPTQPDVNTYFTNEFLSEPPYLPQ